VVSDAWEATPKEDAWEATPEEKNVLFQIIEIGFCKL
jgi:hypothetical protein